MDTVQRVFVFFDGQAVYRQAKDCFGYRDPDYEPLCLAKHVTGLTAGRILKGFFFYTGVPSPTVKPRLSAFWNNKLKAIKDRIAKEPGLVKSKVFEREVLYGAAEKRDPKTGIIKPWLLGHEKGIDIRLCSDANKCAEAGDFDVMIIFSQDSDYTELRDDIIEIAKKQGRTVLFESAYPYSPTPLKTKTYLYGIPGMTPRRIVKADYDNCKDGLTNTYWPK